MPVPSEAPQVLYGPFYRVPLNASEVTAIQQSGLIGGGRARGFYQTEFPTVKAKLGPLPEGSQGYQFYTTVKPTSVSPYGTAPGEARWYTTSEGVISGEIGGEAAAFISFDKASFIVK